jgi:hypothetical protein
MNEIRECIRVVHTRQQRQWTWQCISFGLVTGGLLGCILAIWRLFEWSSAEWTAVAAVLALGPILGWLYSLIRSRPERDAAVAIDRTYGLKDRVTTALGFLSKTSLACAWRDLQLDDTRHHLSRVEPGRVAPVRAPTSWPWGLLLSFAALGLCLIATPGDEVLADVMQNDVVVAQAAAVENGLEELVQFNAEEADPEIEELLKQLAVQIKDLKQPGVDPRDALAKLSEMEAALQEKQQQLSDPATDAQIAAIGETLSLSEEMQAAGQAMAQGELDKAADELAKLEMPKLDRQTEKAVTEKLDEIHQSQGSGSDRKLREAAGKASQGISQGNRNRFQEGMEGLAGECKKQGRRNKLADLLRKQCRCLSECKGECESACKNTANSNKKGGSNWGLGKSENQPGDKTPRLRSDNQMNLTGQESAGGDIDVETLSAPETEQEAVRKYREQSDKYEQLSETVLDSEPIPLGHRQTIRRYFEMIRPQSAELDAVFEKTSE